jgi:hypothetical protein
MRGNQLRNHYIPPAMAMFSRFNLSQQQLGFPFCAEIIRWSVLLQIEIRPPPQMTSMQFGQPTRP